MVLDIALGCFILSYPRLSFSDEVLNQTGDGPTRLGDPIADARVAELADALDLGSSG